MITLVQKNTTITSIENGYSWLLPQKESIIEKNGEKNHRIRKRWLRNQRLLFGIEIAIKLG